MTGRAPVVVEIKSYICIVIVASILGGLLGWLVRTVGLLI